MTLLIIDKFYITVLFRTKPVLLRANQGRINKQTFSGLPHGEP